MKNKYGEFQDEQFARYRKKLHGLIHWLLIYAEENNGMLDHYFDKVQLKLNGLNELLLYPPQLVEIMSLVEAARIEWNKESYRHEVYRKLVLDAHELIDSI